MTTARASLTYTHMHYLNACDCVRLVRVCVCAYTLREAIFSLLLRLAVIVLGIVSSV